MLLTKRSVGPMDNNSYLLVDDGTALLVDAADDAPALLALIGHPPVETIVTTHRHRDHIRALAAVAQATGARLLAGTPDVGAISSATGLGLFGVWDGDDVAVGGVTLEVLGLIGHTPGSIALVYRPATGPVRLFTGDSLFPGGVGRTATDADFRSLLGDVTAKIFDRFDDDTVVHPGHGADTTLGAERPHLAEWAARGW